MESKLDRLFVGKLGVAFIRILQSQQDTWKNVAAADLVIPWHYGHRKVLNNELFSPCKNKFNKIASWSSSFMDVDVLCVCI